MSRDTRSIEALLPGVVNAYGPLPGVATGGQPEPGDLEALAAAGFRTVLDTRDPREPRGYDEARAVEAAGMEYVNVPVGGAITDGLFQTVRKLMTDPARRPVLVHCATGNRVGIVLIPWMVLDEGMSDREALNAAVRMGLRSPQMAQIAFDYAARARGES